MIARALLAALILATGVGSPASAKPRKLPEAYIDASDRLCLAPDACIGRVPQGGKFISQPDSVQIQGPGSTGPVDGMTVTPAGGAETRALSGWLGDLSGALAYVPTLNAKLQIATWLDVPARPQWWGAKCDGVTVDTAAMRAAVAGSTAAGLRLRVSGTCLTETIDFPSKAQIDAVQAGGLKLSGPTGPLLRLAVNADDVLIEGLTFDISSVGTASGDSATSSIFQSVGGTSGRVTIRNNRFKALPDFPANNHAFILNGAYSFVSGNYAEATGGDTYNFNGGFHRVSGNYVGRSGDGCVAFNNNARGIVSGNVLRNCDLAFGAGAFSDAGASDQLQSIIFADNVVDIAKFGVNFGWFGVANREGPVNWTVSGNTFRNIQTAAVNYDGRTSDWRSNGTITGNTFWRTGSADFHGVQGVDAFDIRLANSGGMTITGNSHTDAVGSNSSYGIYITNGADYAISSNQMVSTNGSATYTYGVFLQDAQFAAITSNVMRNVGSGVRLAQSQPGVTHGAVVSSNFFWSMGLVGVHVTESGGDFIIANNYIKSSAGFAGVAISPAAYDFTVTGNVIRWGSGKAIDAPANSWTGYLITNNNTGGGSVPAGAN